MDAIWEISGLPWNELAAAMTWRGDTVLSVAIAVFLFLAGATFASLSGLLADRLPGIMGWEDDGRGLCSPASSCEGCGSPIGAIALIPVVGWVLCRGRCPRCGHRVPALYPVTEAAVGLASALLPVVVDDAATALALLPLAWACLALSWCDLRHHVLPEALTVPLMFAGLLFSPIEQDPWLRSLGAASAAIVTWSAFAFVSRTKRVEAMSGGDVALAAVGGAWLGAYGFPYFIALGCLLFVLHSVPLRMRGVAWVPFGPALCVALLACAVSLS